MTGRDDLAKRRPPNQDAAERLEEHGMASLVEADEVSRQEVTDRAIDERLGHDRKVVDASRRVRARYVDVLGRLGQ